jgi:hypothetical protein
MKKILVVAVLLTALFAAQNANGQKNCEDKKYNSVGSLVREKTEYTKIVQETKENCGYKISFDAYDVETGSIYCDVKFTNLEGKEEKWNGTGDRATIKPKAGTALFVRFWNSTLTQAVLVKYEICRITY